MTSSNPNHSGGGGDCCQICKKPGHSAAKCRFRYDKKEDGESREKKKHNPSFKKNKNKDIKCYNCGTKGHYANECRKPDKRKNDRKRIYEDKKSGSGEPDSKRPKTDHKEGNIKRGAWDEDEFSGMMREHGGDRA
jgi:hypothetical protein